MSFTTQQSTSVYKNVHEILVIANTLSWTRQTVTKKLINIWISNQREHRKKFKISDPGYRGLSVDDSGDVRQQQFSTFVCSIMSFEHFEYYIETFRYLFRILSNISHHRLNTEPFFSPLFLYFRQHYNGTMEII